MLIVTALDGLSPVAQVMVVLCSFAAFLCVLLILTFSPDGARRLNDFFGRYPIPLRRQKGYTKNHRVQRPRRKAGRGEGGQR